jgi:Family of unknown function (DUF6657)
MAEIRSTLDMVMERAARMAARAEDVPAGQEAEQRGMRLVAEFLSGKQSELTPLLQQEAPADQMAVRRGMAKALVRNIVIPRDEMLMASSTTAISGLLGLSKETGEVESVCNELKQLLEQYSQHKEQMKQQLEDAIRTQLAQQVQEQTGASGDPMAIDPTRHPQYQKEWSQAQANLNDQYTQAFDQRKEILMQRFS